MKDQYICTCVSCARAVQALQDVLYICLLITELLLVQKLITIPVVVVYSQCSL